MKRNIYLNTVSFEEAKEVLKSRFSSRYNLEYEIVSVFESLARKTYTPHFALVSNPNYNASAMDGIMVNAEKTMLANERNPVILTLGVDFKYVDTGDVIEKEFNSVIMIEDVTEVSGSEIMIHKPSYEWEHIRVIGEDIVIGEMIVPSNHVITPVDISALLSGANTDINVYKTIKVGVIPTGDEIVAVNTNLTPGQIIDSNSSLFKAMVEEAGARCTRYDIVRDDKELLKAAVKKAAKENDIVVISAGSSAGSEDFTSTVIDELGDLILHGISIKPGKPTIFGEIDGKAVIGIPGYPVSAFISFREFVLPLINGKYNEKKALEKAILSKRVVSSLKHLEFVRVKLGIIDGKLIASPLSRGAGVTMSLVKADAILEIPRNSEGFEVGSEVDVEILRPMEIIENTLISIGSHDILVDELNELYTKKTSVSRISSVHLGSLPGIMAIKRNECHIAPIHLLDPETGEYNKTYISKYLKNDDISIIKGIKRSQGFYVKKGNPDGVKTINDIVSKKLTFANRQRGAGTRVLFDYLLGKEDISSNDIKGYSMELFTHTAVALSVKSGNSDIGMGIESVAKLMGLDFIEIAYEDYDFIFKNKNREHKLVKDFIETLKSDDFRRVVNRYSGYKLMDIEVENL
ncbi:MAG: molybdopterin biosynthesis protein [Acidaminobacteraceae bacterium]